MIAQQPQASSQSPSQASSQPSSQPFLSIFKLEDVSPRWGFPLWTLTFDLPGEKVNKMSVAVMAEFELVLAQLTELGSAGKIGALALVSGKPSQFIAGADIDMIRSAKTAEDAEALSTRGQAMISRWEDLSFPTVAVIDGPALGGGCELSLGSTAILMSNDPAARIGLPEVMLGIIPGTGGCIRLPRKVGIATALDMILTGMTLNGERAAKAGLIEACLPKENFKDSAFAWIKSNLPALKSGHRIAREPKLGGAGGAIGAVLEKTPMGRALMIRKAREGVMQKTRGNYPAPLEALDVISETGAYGEKLKGAARDRAMAREAKGFGEMAATEISKNLIRIFFMTEGVKKSKGVSSAQNATSIKSGAVLGAGVMGGGIAQLMAEKKVGVRMKDLNLGALALGVNSASKIFERDLKRRRINSRQYLQKLNLISPTLDFSGFKSVDVVIEAVIEKMDVKQKVFQELEGRVSESCVIASNTSSLSISEMQSVMNRPERFVGMHFFNPVHKMPLVEVIRGGKTSDGAVSTIFQFAKQLGKTPIVVKDSPGFLVNRLLMPYLNEAMWLLSEGAPIPEIDRAMLEFGMPVGPIELVDEVGIDVGDKVAGILFGAFGARFASAQSSGKMLESKRLGKKSGKGFYDYNPKDRSKTLSPEIYSLLGVTPKPGFVAASEIVERCVLPMINEASRCLEEQVVENAAEVDLGMIMGTGFPPFRGGLLRYADTLGLGSLVERMRHYQGRFGVRFEPSSALLVRAEKNLPFYPK